jgi:hypothetical protein
LHREELAWQQNNAAQFSQFLDRQIPREWRRDWFLPWGIEPSQRTTLGVQMVQIEQAQPVAAHTLVTHAVLEWWRGLPYQELRFYRQTETGWVRTKPAVEDWGRLHTLATPHLQFEFYERDAAPMLALAEPMERAYVKLYALLGRKLPPQPITLTFAVVPDRVHEFTPTEDGLTFSSPLLLKTPVGLTPSQYTAHLIVNRLADQALRQMVDSSRRRGANRWQSMVRAANGRLRSEILGQRSPWQQQAERLFRQTNWTLSPLRLTDISDRYSGKIPSRATIMWEYMAAESVIDYVVQVYGWEGLAALIRGFGEFSFWNGLIPSVFGVSVPEFEVGWNRYLAEQQVGD